MRKLSKEVSTQTRIRVSAHIPLVANRDDLTIGKLVRLLERGRLCGGLHLLLKVERDVAELLLDVADDFTLGSGGEGVTALHEDLDEVIGEITAGQIETEDSVRERETLVNRDSVGHTITGVEDDTSRAAGCVERKDGLDGDVEGRGVEGLEHDLSHLLAVSLRVERRLGQEDGVLLGRNTELVVEGVMPDLLHVVPVRDDTVLNRVLEREDTTLGLSLVTERRSVHMILK